MSNDAVSKSPADVEFRLANPEPLTEEELRAVMRHVGALSVAAVRRLEAEAAIQTIAAVRQAVAATSQTAAAIRKLDENSNKIGSWTLLLNVALFILAIVATLTALISLHEANKGAKQQVEALGQQQMTLQQSRSALESVVSTATEQKALLDQSLETLRSLTNITSERTRREIAKENRAPKVQVVLLLPEEDRAIELHPGTDHGAGVVFTGNPLRLYFYVFNEGDAPIEQPTIVVGTTPPTIRLQCEEGQKEFEGGCSYTWPYRIAPSSETRTVVVFSPRFTIPEGMKAFSLELGFAGANIRATTYSLDVILLDTYRQKIK